VEERRRRVRLLHDKGLSGRAIARLFDDLSRETVRNDLAAIEYTDAGPGLRRLADAAWWSVRYDGVDPLLALSYVIWPTEEIVNALATREKVAA
jgi:hypothetical protein